MTEFELINEVQKFYNGYCTISKAMLLFEIEHGYIPEITEDTKKVSIDSDFLDSIGKGHLCDAMIFMKKLQESGSVNMFGCLNIIQTGLLVDKDEARDILLTYTKYYTDIYFPELFI